MRDPVIVLKFGSSVLGSPADLPTVVQEIHREVGKGRRVVAVVSAFAGVTDALLAEVRARHEEPDPHGLARILETGESVAAAALGLQLEEAGVPAEVVDASGIGLTAAGAPLDATPTHLARRRLEELLARVPVVVVPGFSGRDRQRRPVLLGRGGSDFTALFLARRLGAVECRLLKDIDGLLRVHPDGTLDHATRYAEAHYRDCLSDGGPLVQPRAVEFARRHGMDFVIARCGSERGTLAGSVATRLEPMPETAPVRVALAGLGTVGLGVYRLLAGLTQDVEVIGVLVRDAHRIRADEVPRGLLTGSVDELLDRAPDVVVETIGGTGAASQLVHEALARGLSVATANKVLVAGDRHLLDVLRDDDQLLCSAAVGGAVPMIEQVRAAVESEPVTVLRGVLNGTCNAVLDQLAAGSDLDDAVAAARRRGLAEANPAADLDGRDAAAKLAILVATAFDSRLDPRDIPSEPIGPDTVAHAVRARAAGRVLRQVAYAERRGGRLAASIRLRELEADDPLAACAREDNALIVILASGRTVAAAGKGAGRWPTGTAVVSDVLELVRRVRSRGAAAQPLAAEG